MEYINADTISNWINTFIQKAGTALSGVAVGDVSALT
jgi:hypothetical protein